MQPTVQSASQTQVKVSESARRRPAYDRADAAYNAGKIGETARQLAKWQIRYLAKNSTYFETTQADQAARFYYSQHKRCLSRRHIIRLNDELEAAGLIWRQPWGTGYRTYISTYVAPPELDPVDEEQTGDAPHTQPAPDVCAPTYADLHQAIDQAVQAGEHERAALLSYQLAMLLASQADIALPAAPPPWVPDGPAPAPQQQRTPTPRQASFCAPLGDMNGTNLVTQMAPSPLLKRSSIPKGIHTTSVCDDGDKQTQRRASKPEDPLPDTEATRLLRRLGVEDRASLRAFSAAPCAVIEQAEQRRAELGYSPGMIVKILRDGGKIWRHGSCQQARNPRTPEPASDDAAAWERYYLGGVVQSCVPVDWLAQNAEEASSAPADAPPPGGAEPALGAAEPSGVAAPANPLDSLWRTMLQQLAPLSSDAALWLGLSWLVAHEEDLLVIGCRNVFVRDKINETYLEQLQAAANAVLDQPVTLHTVIRTQG